MIIQTVILVKLIFIKIQMWKEIFGKGLFSVMENIKKVHVISELGSLTNTQKNLYELIARQ